MTFLRGTWAIIRTDWWLHVMQSPKLNYIALHTLLIDWDSRLAPWNCQMSSYLMNLDNNCSNYDCNKEDDEVESIKDNSQLAPLSLGGHLIVFLQDFHFINLFILLFLSHICLCWSFGQEVILFYAKQITENSKEDLEFRRRIRMDSIEYCNFNKNPDVCKRFVLTACIYNRMKCFFFVKRKCLMLFESWFYDKATPQTFIWNLMESSICW